MFYFFINSDPYQNNFYLEQVERAHSSNTGLIAQKLDCMRFPCFFFCLMVPPLTALGMSMWREAEGDHGAAQ